MNRSNESSGSTGTQQADEGDPVTDPSSSHADGIWVGRTVSGHMLWVFDPCIPHPNKGKVYAFALHAGQMREYGRRQVVVANLSRIDGEAGDAAIAEYLRWKEAHGAAFLLDKESGREQEVLEAKRAAAEEERRRAERISALAIRMALKQAKDGSAICRMVEERGILFLAHFTRIENLAGIVEKGLVPKTFVSSDSLHNDAMRLDGFPEASSLSVSFPNYLMFYRYRCLQPDSNWAVLRLATNVLVDIPCLFFQTNAANGRFRNASDDALGHMMGLDGLSSMFLDDPISTREERGLLDHETTDPQAEVLAFSTVDPEKIGAICSDAK